MAERMEKAGGWAVPRKLRTFVALGTRRKLLVAEAVLSLITARLMLAAFPFRRIAQTLGRFVPPDDPRVPALSCGPATEESRTAREIGWAVRAIAPWLPFRTACLQQALAARAMLRRRDIPTALHFGAGRTGGVSLDAHAWLDAAGVKVIGYPVAPHLREIGVFV